MGAEETDTEVPISEMAPRPDPGRQYVGWAGGVLQVCDGSGGSRATTTEAGGGVEDARTGPGDADGDGAGLAMGAELCAELAGSEFRADVALKDESAGVAATMECERSKLMGGAEAAAALHAGDEARQREVLTGSAKAYVGPIWPGDGAAFSGEAFKSGALECENSMGRSG